MRFRVWVIIASILPIAAIVVLRWNVGMSGLLSFIGTVVNGCLQITLAIGIKETTLPSWVCYSEQLVELLRSNELT
jgi:hypothetical protein